MMRILMPVLNGEKTLPRAVGSLRRQTNNNWCLKVSIDPHTTDRTLHVLGQLEREPDEFHILLGNAPGSPHRYLDLMDVVRGENTVCGVLDADDELMPDAVETMLRAYEQDPELEMAWSQFEFFPEVTMQGMSRPLPKGKTIKEAFATSQWWGAHHFRTFRKRAFTRSTFPLPAHLPYAIDANFAAVLADSDPKTLFVDRILYRYHWHDGTVSVHKHDAQMLCLQQGRQLFQWHVRRGVEDDPH